MTQALGKQRQALTPDQEGIGQASYGRWRLSLALKGWAGLPGRGLGGGEVGCAFRQPEPGDERVGLVWGTEISRIMQSRRRLLEAPEEALGQGVSWTRLGIRGDPDRYRKLCPKGKLVV